MVANHYGESHGLEEFGSISHCYRTGSCGVVHTGHTASHGVFRMSLVGLFRHGSLMLTGGSVNWYLSFGCLRAYKYREPLLLFCHSTFSPRPNKVSENRSC